MLGIFSLTPEDEFLEMLSDSFSLRTFDDFDPDEDVNLDSLFIDWVPKVPVYEGAWMVQASLLQKYIKTGIPIVIFDRNFSLTEKEVDWVRKFDVNLFEPALNTGRKGFSYLPEWITDFNIWKADNEREYDLVYSTEFIEYRLKGFNEWIVDYARLFPDMKVAYSTLNVSEFKKEEFKNNNLIFLKEKYPIFAEGSTTVAFDKKRAYEIGYLDRSYIIAMNMGCLPLLPVEHKYFHSMFDGLVFGDLNELDYYISTYSRVKNEIIEEIFDRIQSNWPEFTVDHAVNTIRECYE